jgi:redox-sensitive bicupin YhaK (pirin superfamily)
MIQPKYRNIDHRNIPIVTLDDGTIVKLMAGGSIKAPGYGIVEGPVNDLTVPVIYLDVYMREHSEFVYKVRDGYTTFAYVMEGSAIFDRTNSTVNDKELVVYSREGGKVHVRTNDKPVRFLLLSSRPIGDPIAVWTYCNEYMG